MVIPIINRSSKYKTIIIILLSYFFKYTFVSDLHLSKFGDSKKESNLAYQALRAYFKPYKDFCSCKIIMDLMCILQDTSCRSLIASLHEENHYLHPYGAPPSVWMHKWLRLDL